jgi:hypothetical protein
VENAADDSAEVAAAVFDSRERFVRLIDRRENQESVADFFVLNERNAAAGLGLSRIASLRERFKSRRLRREIIAEYGRVAGARPDVVDRKILVTSDAPDDPPAGVLLGKLETLDAVSPRRGFLTRSVRVGDPRHPFHGDDDPRRGLEGRQQLVKFAAIDLRHPVERRLDRFQPRNMRFENLLDGRCAVGALNPKGVADISRLPSVKHVENGKRECKSAKNRQQGGPVAFPRGAHVATFGWLRSAHSPGTFAIRVMGVRLEGGSILRNSRCPFQRRGDSLKN